MASPNNECDNGVLLEAHALELFRLCKYKVNAVDHTNDSVVNSCNLTVFGKALKSFLLSSNRIVAVFIIQSFITHHH